MDLKDLSITQVAALIGAVGTIVGTGFTIDNRYAKNSEIENVRKELRVSLDNLHKQILENEQLKNELGNNAQAAKVLAERNKRELDEIRQRLNYESMRIVKKSMIQKKEQPHKVVSDEPEVVETKPE